MRVWILLIADMRAAWRDCLPGLLRPGIAAWLSAKITHFVNVGGLANAMSVVSSNPVMFFVGTKVA